MTRLIVLALMSSLLAGSALACECPVDKKLQAHLDETDVIFEGVAIETWEVSRPYIGGRQTRFKVTRTWKGELPEHVVIGHQHNKIASCGMGFKPGENYRIFASRTEHESLFTGHCSGPFFEWAEYEAILGKGRKVE